MSEPLRAPEGNEAREALHSESELRRRLTARREHALQSLLELSRELTVALDPFETADLLLFNLMGQFGSARSALWLTPDEDGAQAVLVRAHGFSRSLLDGIGAACEPALRERFAADGSPTLAWALNGSIDDDAFELVRLSGIAVLGPLRARGELLGWVGLGDRVDGNAYGDDELQVLEAALGTVAVSFHNARLYSRAREANRHLRASNDQLQSLDQLKTEFLSNVNHELRTPLAVVIATLDCLGEHPGVETRARGMLASSLVQAKKLKGLIENLLTFSEVRDSRLEVQVETADVGSLLAEWLLVRQPGVTAGLRELSVHSAATDTRARFDPKRLGQIVDELLDNAIKFTPRGSRIALEVDRIHESGADWVRITVTDDGPGIPEDRRGSLFNAFEQVDGSATRTAGGLGLGLSFARALVQRMGGRLELENTAGPGCTFRTWLPGA
jgi:signal transduction histidine kinase